MGVNAKLEDITEAGALDGSELLYVVQSGNSRKVKLASIYLPTATNDLSTLDIPDSKTYIETSGYYTAGDGGGAKWRQLSGSDPTEPGEKTTNGGAKRWGIAEKTPNVLMFGAKADGDYAGGGTDASGAVQDGSDFVEQVLGGGVLFAPIGLYRMAATVTIGASVLLCGHAPGHSSAGAVVQFIADLSLATVFETNGGAANKAVGFEKLSITRQDGTIPASSVGVRFLDTSSPYMRDCFILRHAAPVECNTDGVGLLLENVILSQATETFLRWLNGPQLTLIGCSFGVNGGLDQPCDSYIEIDGSGGGKLDTFNAIRCQFNATNTGATDTDYVGTLLDFKSYSDTDGILNFVACHAEHFNINGNGNVVRGDASTTVIPRMTFDASCSINTSATNNNFFAIDSACVLSPFSFFGRTSFNMNLSGANTSVYRIAGVLDHDFSCTGARNLILGGKIGGNITLSGTITQLLMDAVYEGSITDTSTKTSSSSIASRITGSFRWLTHNLNINPVGRLTSLAVRGVDHALQQAGNDGNTASYLLSRWSANASPALYEFFKSRSSTVGTHSAVQSGDSLGLMVFTGSDGSAGAIAAEQEVLVTGTVSSGVVQGVIRWLTRNASSLAERMRLDQNGNLGIGETAPDYKLDVNGAIGFTPGSSVTPVDNGDVVFEATSNTSFTVKFKGSDGTVRTAVLTLA